MAFVLRAPTVFTGSRVLIDGWVAVQDGTVVESGSGELPPAFAQAEITEVAGMIAPGYVDIHCHGGGGGAFGGVGEQAIAAARTALATHRAHGTTTMVASLVTGLIDDVAGSVGTLGTLYDSGEIAGIHLEGPWLSVAHKGAHNPEQLVAPTARDIATIFDAHHGAVKMVTIAPELEGGLDAVRDFVERGAIAAIGHTDASYDQAAAAIDAGVTNVTHLFNAMNPIHHRIPGPIVKLLEDSRVTVELICDGVHLHPAIIAHAVKAAGAGRFILVTDAMDATDMSDGSYMLGSLAVTVKDGVARLTQGGAIAGSTLTMERAVQYTVHEAGVPLEVALEAATRTPAKAIGRTDIGHLDAGARADLVVLNSDLSVAQVYQGGDLVVTR